MFEAILCHGTATRTLTFSQREGDIFKVCHFSKQDLNATQNSVKKSLLPNFMLLQKIGNISSLKK